MDHYILFLRNEDIDFPSYSPEQIQKIISEFDDWNASMIREGRLIASGSLQNGKGKTIRTGNVVADGPYSEAKEAVAGFLLIQAESYDDAATMAARCPFLPRGGSVEVRMVPKLDFEDAALPVMEEHARERAKQQSRKGA